MNRHSRTHPFVTAEEFNRAISSQRWLGQWVGAQATDIDGNGATVRLDLRPEFLRPGGSVSGPIVMAIADIAMYAALAGAHRDGMLALTSDMTMHFLRRPVGPALRARARILRNGRRLFVCAVDVFVEGQDDSVCHVVGSYVLPTPAAGRAAGA
jgi:uncharacterized protein (TIGR00369 family)